MNSRRNKPEDSDRSIVVPLALMILLNLAPNPAEAKKRTRGRGASGTNTDEIHQARFAGMRHLCERCVQVVCGKQIYGCAETIESQSGELQNINSFQSIAIDNSFANAEPG